MPDDFARRIAVVIPCLNEEASIGLVARKFRTVLPAAELYVVDNNSTDATERWPARPGRPCCGRPVAARGTRSARRSARVEADIYILVDGDDAHPAEDAPQILQPIPDGDADIVVATRLAEDTGSAFRRINRLGSRLLLGALNLVFACGSPTACRATG